MDSGNITKILLLAALILMSAYFSATETAFSSLNRIRIKNLAHDGSRKAQLVLMLYEDYDKLLSTILIGNNIVNIAAASLGTVLFVGYCGDAGVTVSTAVITVVVLIFGEVSPKSLAKESPESFSMFSAPFIRILMVLFTPFSLFFVFWKKLLSGLFRTDGDKRITEEELITIVEEAEQEGGINAGESELIRSAIEFDDIEVTGIFTPRTDVIAVSADDGKQEIERVFLESGYSRLPVYNKSIDDIVGVINHKDFHDRILHTSEPLGSIINPAIFVIPSMKISKLLKRLQSAKSHMAVILDEYGGTMGIVTLEDIIEELVGEIWDEHDEIIREFEKISENEYRISCGANIEKMFRLFDIEKETDNTTVSGWLIAEMGRIPDEGESFDYENLGITVTKTDGRRVIEILVSVRDKTEEGDPE